MTPEERLAALPPQWVAWVQKLRALVGRTLPEAVERVYPVWKGFGYRHPEAGYVGGIFLFRDHVALAFERGAVLPDPEGLLVPGRTSGKQVRYVEIRRPSDIRVKPIQALLRAAVSVRSGGGRRPPSSRRARGW